MDVGQDLVPHNRREALDSLDEDVLLDPKRFQIFLCLLVEL